MRTHDYTKDRRGWGHDLIFKPIDGGQQADATGWGSGIEAGDFMLLSNGNDATRYYVESVTYYRDPPDMWQAKLWFAPRPSTCPDCGEPAWEAWRMPERNYVLRQQWKCGHFREEAA